MNEILPPRKAGKSASTVSIPAESMPGQGPSGASGQKAPKKITETYLKNAGAYYLQRYAASTAKFRAVMTRKIETSCRFHMDQNRHECLQLLDAVIEKFEALGYLNDTSYARTKVSSLYNRGLSGRMIEMKLRADGVNIDQIRQAIDCHAADRGTTSAASEMASAMKLAKKKRVGPYAITPDYDRNKAIAAFARAGFSFDTIRKVLDADPSDAFPGDGADNL